MKLRANLKEKKLNQLIFIQLQRNPDTASKWHMLWHCGNRYAKPICALDQSGWREMRAFVSLFISPLQAQPFCLRGG